MIIENEECKTIDDLSSVITKKIESLKRMNETQDIPLTQEFFNNGSIEALSCVQVFIKHIQTVQN